jgi:cytochrome c oxidase subunit I
MTALFFGIGFGIVVLIRWWANWQPILDWQPIILVAALVAAPVGFLAGIGTFDYWVYYVLGKPTRA